jgi:single-strand DNA-binding protein
MAGNTVTLTGNLTRDPELRFTPNGMAVGTFSLAHNARKKEGNEWVDDPKYFDCTVFGEMAENVCETLTKGTRVVLEGRLDWQQWTNDEGSKRSKIQVIVDSIGPDLRWVTAVVRRKERATSSNNQASSETRRAPAPRPAAQDTGYGFDDEPF